MTEMAASGALDCRPKLLPLRFRRIPCPRTVGTPKPPEHGGHLHIVNNNQHESTGKRSLFRRVFSQETSHRSIQGFLVGVFQGDQQGKRSNDGIIVIQGKCRKSVSKRWGMDSFGMFWVPIRVPDLFAVVILQVA